MGQKLKLIMVAIILIAVARFGLAEQDTSLDQTYLSIISRITALEHEIQGVKEQLSLLTVKKVRLTYYVPKWGGINSDATPDKTATMTTPVAGRTCAISTNLVEEGWLGHPIYIQGIEGEGVGIRIATDRMAASIEGYHIDLCANDKITIPNQAFAIRLIAIDADCY